MFKKQKLMFLYAEMPIHPGSGTSAGVIDLTVQREVTTELPIIQPSGLKGAIREYFEDKYKGNTTELNKVKQVFGPPESDFAGAMSLSQARVLLFPLASLKGVFAYATSPLCLHLLSRDLLTSTGSVPSEMADIPEPSDEKIALIPKDHSAVKVGSKVILGDFGFDAEESESLGKIGEWISTNAMPQEPSSSTDIYGPWQEKVKSNIVLLSDEVFRDFTRTKIEIVYRNKIGEKGVVEKGALWSEEHIPADTLMWSNIFAMPPLNEYTGGLTNENEVVYYMENNGLTHFFVGGDQTTGKGLVRVKFL